MKKKIKKKRLYQQWLFWLMIIVISTFVLTFVSWSSEPHFKIYEEVCWNESIWIGEEVKNMLDKNVTQNLGHLWEGASEELCLYIYEEDNYCKTMYGNTNITPIRLYTKWDCSDYKSWWEGDIKIMQRFEKSCEKDLNFTKYIKIEELDYEFGGYAEWDKIPVFYEEKEDYFEGEVYLDFITHQYLYDDIYETKEKCKQVEVDEIEYFKDITKENPTCEGAMIRVRDCKINNKSDCIYGKCLQFNIISKKDLSIEWLDENCEKIYLESLTFFQFDVNCKKNASCFEEMDNLCRNENKDAEIYLNDNLWNCAILNYYKCGENYYVEIEK